VTQQAMIRIAEVGNKKITILRKREENVEMIVTNFMSATIRNMKAQQKISKEQKLVT
jgi:hypothetical protein